MSSKNSVKLYNYEEINNLSVTEKHFSITDKNSKKSIIFISKEVSQMKGNFEKGYFIIEGKMEGVQTYIKTAELQKIKDLDREICIIWNHGGKVREYRFTGRCVCYTEHYSGNNNYFEIVLQETTAVSEYNRFIKINDYYAFVEITPNTMKAITKSDVIWSENGIVLGTAAVIGGVTAVLTGGVSIIAVVTIFYGVNTVASSTVDMAFCFSGNGEKLESFNFIRDSVFGNIGQFFTETFGLNKNISKERSDIAYMASELFLGYKGIRSLLKELKTGWKVGKTYVSLKTRKVSIAGGRISDNFGAKRIDFLRFGYHVYQICDGLRSGKGYVLKIYKEAKVIDNKTKAKFTNPSAIEVLR